MNSGKLIREFDACGRLSIPVEIRNRLIQDGNGQIEMCMEGNVLLLLSVQDTCCFCGSNDSLLNIKSKLICNLCLDKII